MRARRCLTDALCLLQEAERVAAERGLEREHGSAVGLAQIRGIITGSAAIVDAAPWWARWALAPAAEAVHAWVARLLADYHRIARRYGHR